MKIIICVDDRLGVAFNHRRQSRDRAVQENIAGLVGTSPLYIEEYSLQLFQNSNCDTRVVSHIVDQDPGFCFLERQDPAQLHPKIETLVVYKWNRVYPSDVRCTLDLSDGTWQLTDQLDFKGYSHEKISREIYSRQS